MKRHHVFIPRHVVIDARAVSDLDIIEVVKHDVAAVIVFADADEFRMRHIDIHYDEARANALDVFRLEKHPAKHFNRLIHSCISFRYFCLNQPQ